LSAQIAPPERFAGAGAVARQVPCGHLAQSQPQLGPMRQQICAWGPFSEFDRVKACGPP
jgi:hypothetical protein